MILLAIAVLWGCKRQDVPDCGLVTPVKLAASCEAGAQTRAVWQEDAQRLALRSIVAELHTAIDSIYVPQDLVDEKLDILLAVQDAINGIGCEDLNPVRDIHTFPDIVLNEMLVQVDTSVFWVREWQAGNSLTGMPIVDTLMATFGFVLQDFYQWNSGDFALLGTNQTLNLLPLLETFKDIDGVVEAFENSVVGDGNDIQYTRENGFDVLEYSLGSEDCPSGCLQREIWTFRVYPDCVVEYVGMRTEG